MRELAPDSLSVSVNLAHVHLHSGRCAEAIHLYQSALKSMPLHRSTDLLECLALAQLRSGQHMEAIQSLQRAVALDPDSVRLLFNLAFVRQDLAIIFLNRTPRTARDIEQAIDLFHSARRVFALLMTGAVVERTRAAVNIRLIEPLEKHCVRTIELAERYLKVAVEEERAVELLREAHEAEHAERLQALLRAQAEAAEAAERARRELQDKAADKARRLEALQQTWSVSTAPAAEKKSRKGKRKDGGRDEGSDTDKEASDEVEREAAAPQRKKKAKRAARARPEVYDSDEDSRADESAEEGAGAARGSGRGRAEVFDSDEEEEAGEAAGAPVKSAGLLQKRAAVEEADDEEIDFESGMEVGGGGDSGGGGVPGEAAVSSRGPRARKTIDDDDE